MALFATFILYFSLIQIASLFTSIFNLLIISFLGQYLTDFHYFVELTIFDFVLELVELATIENSTVLLSYSDIVIDDLKII